MEGKEGWKSVTSFGRHSALPSTLAILYPGGLAILHVSQFHLGDS